MWALSDFLAGRLFSALEIRFIQMIVDELTANGTVPTERPYEHRSRTSPGADPSRSSLYQTSSTS